MDRRGFLGSLIGASVFALDPERALWVPGKKLISIPKVTAAETGCPFTIFSRFGEPDDPAVDVLNQLMRHRWRTEPEFRSHYRILLTPDLAYPAEHFLKRSLLEDLQCTEIIRRHLSGDVYVLDMVPPPLEDVPFGVRALRRHFHSTTNVAEEHSSVSL